MISFKPSLKERTIQLWCFTFLFIIYALNLRLDIMDVDAAQYADIAREMSITNSFLQVYMKGKDYLDKPPLLFWLSSLSFKIFGISNIAYKLPAFLAIILTLLSTYKFGALWYSKKIGIIATLILGSTQAFFLMSNDVRTDGLLMCCCIFSLWQFSIFLKHRSLTALALGSLGLGLAMLSKGPLGLMIIGIGIFFHLIYTKNLKAILDWRWGICFFIVALVLLPMSIGLYQQFDLHPEKFAYGLQGPSGLKFFYWTQSFGRITGESSWSNDTSFFFFFHSILWDFMPWTIFLFGGIFLAVRRALKKKLPEYISISSFLFPFLILSFSNYKLPHYIFPLFPFISIATSIFIHELFYHQKTIFFRNIKKTLAKTQYCILFLLLIILGVGLTFFFYVSLMMVIVCFLFLVSLIILFIFRKSLNSKFQSLFYATFFIQILVGLVMSLYLYPNILKYQSPTYAGKWAFANKLNDSQFFEYHFFHHSLDFYGHRNTQRFNPDNYLSYKKPIYIYTDRRNKKSLDLLFKEKISILKQFPHHKATDLSLDFLLPQLRQKSIDTSYLIQLY